MRKTLSPYYIDIPLVSPLSGLTCIKYTLEIYIWDGSRTSPLSTPSYSKTIINSSGSTATHKINISRLINDFIEFEPKKALSTSLLDGENQRWVKTQVLYETENETEIDTPQSVSSDIIVKGYSYGNEGENQETPSNKVLLSGSKFKVSRTGTFVVPIEIDESSPPTPSIVLNSVTFDTGISWDLDFTLIGSYSELNVLLEPTTGDSHIQTKSVVSPQSQDVKYTSQDVDVTLSGFDNDSATTITSNTITITVP